jgi:hypothetical protein
MLDTYYSHILLKCLQEQKVQVLQLIINGVIPNFNYSHIRTNLPNLT